MKSLAIAMFILSSSLTAFADVPKVECTKKRDGNWNSRPPEVVAAERLRLFDQVTAGQNLGSQGTRTTR